MTKINLDVGNKVTLKVNANSAPESYTATIKKIKTNLLALVLSEAGQDSSSIPLGTPSQIQTTEASPAQLISGKIVETKAFPLVIMKVENTETVDANNKKPSDDFEEKDIVEISIENTDTTHVDDRDSARIGDSFPLEFYVQGSETVEQKKDEYILRPTKYRREKAKYIQQGEEQDILDRISHLDPALLDVIRDIYARISKLSSAKSEKKAQGTEYDNVGDCIDLSGTGLKLLCKKKLKKDDFLKLMISPPRANPPFSISALGQVKNVKKEKDNRYTVGIMFFAINEDDIEEIVQYTFQLQREQLRLQRYLKKNEDDEL